MMSMQRDAMRRVQEMQRRSTEMLNNSKSAGSQENMSSAEISDSAPSENTNRNERNRHQIQVSQQTQETQKTQGKGQGHSVAKKRTSNDKPIQSNTAIGSSPIEKILKDLNLDSDRIIILVLILVLMNEGADKSMLLALFYILV